MMGVVPHAVWHKRQTDPNGVAVECIGCVSVPGKCKRYLQMVAATHVEVDDVRWG